MNFGEEVVRIQDISFKTKSDKDKKTPGAKSGKKDQAAGEETSKADSTDESGSGDSAAGTFGDGL